jgi:L-threonylcarbamoyladenylate synthase
MNTDINQEVHNAFEIIKEGGIILYPTDTVWGIGCDATNEASVSKIFTLKNRIESKAMIVLLEDETELLNYVEDQSFQIFDYIKGIHKPTTVIYPKAKNVASNLIASDNTLGIRLVKEPFCFKLMEKMKKPLVSTSANISGQPTPIAFKDISQEIIKGVDYVVNLHQDKIAGKPSTIIKLSNDSQVKIIRK